jgi:nucleotide-binding universal stress UspA family protein
MAFRAILSVTGAEASQRDLALATRLSAEMNAHLAVLIARVAAAAPVGEYAVMASDVWVKEREREIAEVDGRVSAVKELLREQGIAGEAFGAYWEMAWLGEAVAHRARHADLTVFGPDLLAQKTIREPLINGALFESGRPALIVPDDKGATLKPSRVSVAWDGRTEAARAIRDALPVLAGAEDVRLVLVDPEETTFGHGPEPGVQMAAYIARHDVRVTIDRLPSMGKSTAEVLSRHARDIGAEMLVMGAYGHSRLRERLFGGTTYAMLKAPPVTLFMAR